MLVLYGSPLLDWVGVGTVGDEGSDVVETSCVDVLENISSKLSLSVNLSTFPGGGT